MKSVTFIIKKRANKKLRHKKFVKLHRIIKLHRIGTYDVYKISLSCFDDKRYILDNGVNTLAYFHKDINE